MFIHDTRKFPAARSMAHACCLERTVLFVTISTMSPLAGRPLAQAIPSLAWHFSSCPSRPLSTSRQWIERHIRDKYVKQARYQSYRARSAFKLIQIDDKYRLIKPGMIVVECGAAPGSWTQVLVERLRLASPNPYKTGALLAVDISTFAPVEGAICLPQTDFTSPLSQAKILSALNDRKVDLLVSDMSPNVTGQHQLDHERILQLVYATLQFSLVCLKENGNFLAKMFQGQHTDQLVKHLAQLFHVVKRVKPEASRGDSTELYLLAMQFKKTSLAQSSS